MALPASQLESRPLPESFRGHLSGCHQQMRVVITPIGAGAWLMDRQVDRALVLVCQLS
jgi:hypothetical protein